MSNSKTAALLASRMQWCDVDDKVKLVYKQLKHPLHVILHWITPLEFSFPLFSF